MEFGRVVKYCRMCGSSRLYKFLDLGFAPAADAILTSEEIKEHEIHFPLNVHQCLDCGLTQLGYAANPPLLYGKQYKYESSITETGKIHFHSMARSLVKRFNLGKDSLAIDIGSNVGVLLEGFKNEGVRVLGIEPVQHLSEIANGRGIETLTAFINPQVAHQIVKEKGRAQIISGTNVFAHIDDKKGLIDALNILLDERGVFVIEAPYFGDLMENLEYDTIYVEHLEYTSIKPLIKFFDKNGMDVFDVERYDIHGKSLRVFVCRKGKMEISNEVNKLLMSEEESGIYKREKLDDFASKVRNHRKELVNLLTDLKNSGKRVVGISAPAKGNTILNYCRIGPELIEYITEKSGIKPEHYTPGMHIPIVSEKKLLEDKPDYGIIFAWNFAEEIMKNNAEFARLGGKFIIPIPKPVIR